MARDMREWMITVERQLKEARRSGVPIAIKYAKDALDQANEALSDYKGLKPTNPIELTYQTALYTDTDGVIRGRVTIDFPDVVFATDGTPITVTRYELQGRPEGYGNVHSAYPGHLLPGQSYPGTPGSVMFSQSKLGPMRTVAYSDTSSFTVEGITQGQTLRYRVRAVGGTFTNDGLWSQDIVIYVEKDLVPPPQPTAPRVRVERGVIMVDYDGAAVTGEMPADLDYVALAHGTESSPIGEVYRFSRSGGTYVLPGAKYYDVQFFRLRARDQSKNWGPWSEQATGTATPLVDEDVILSRIDAAETIIDNAGALILESGETLLDKLEQADLDRQTSDSRLDDAQEKLNFAFPSLVSNAKVEAIDEATKAAAADAQAKLEIAQAEIDRVWASARSYINSLTTLDGIKPLQGSTPTIVDSPTAMGGKALQKAGTTHSWWEDTNGHQAFDPTALYRISARVRATDLATKYEYKWAGAANASSSVIEADGVVIRENRAANPSFELDTAGWIGHSTVIARDTTWGYTGTCSLKMTNTVNGNYNTSTTVPIIEGKAYTLSVYMKHNASVNRDLRVDYAFENASGARIGSYTAGTVVSAATGVAVRPSVTTIAAPAGATVVRVYAIGLAMMASTDTVWIDSVLVEEGTSVGSYFDGNTADNMVKMIYLGVNGYLADGVTYCNTTGANTYSSQHYIYYGTFTGAVNEWVDYTYYFKGNAVGTSSGGNTVLDPKKLHENVRYFAPMMILDYSGGDGTWEVSHLSVDVVDAAGHQALVDAETARLAAVDATKTANAIASPLANPSFDDWPTTSTYPTGYTVWTAGPTRETGLVRRPPNAIRFTQSTLTDQRGLNLSGVLNVLPNYEYVTVELEFMLVSGSTLQGAGVLVDWVGLTPYRAFLSLGEEIPAPVTNRWYRVTKVLRRPVGATGTWTNMSGYLMCNYSTMPGGNGGPKTLVYDWLNVRPATAEEVRAITAESVANAALTMAGSKSKVFYDTGEATGTANDGDTWRQTSDTSGDVLAEWRWEGTPETGSWVPQRVTSEMVSNLDVGKLTVGTGVISQLVAQHIAAQSGEFIELDVSQLRAAATTIDTAVIDKLWTDVVNSRQITTNMLLVGGGENLWVDQYFESDTATIGAIYTGAEVAPRGNIRTMKVRDHVASSTTQFEVVPGDTIVVEYTAKRVLGARNLRATVWLWAPNGSGVSSPFTMLSYFSEEVAVGAPDANGWQRYRSTSQIPEARTDVGKATLYFQIDQTAGAYDTEWLVSDVRLRRGVESEVIVDGAITTRKLTVTEDMTVALLAAHKVQAGEIEVNTLFADAAFTGSLNTHIGTFLTHSDGTGYTTTVTGQGMKVTYTDAVTGEVSDRLKLGTFDEEYLGFTDDAGETSVSMDKTGSIAARRLDIRDAITLGGIDLNERLTAMPQRLVAWSQLPTNQMPQSNGEVGLFELGWQSVQEGEPQRMYFFQMNNVIIEQTRSGTVGLRLRYTNDGSAPTINSPMIAYSYAYTPADATYFSTHHFNRIIGSNNGPYMRVLVSLYDTTSGVATVWSGTGQTHMYATITDLGETTTPTGSLTTAGGTPYTGSTTTAPTNPTVTYTKEWAATGVRSYIGNDTIYNYNTSKGYQGLSPAGYGNLKSIYTFPSLTSTLSGATIQDIWAYVYFEHWYYNAGGMAQIRLHGNSSLPATNNLSSNGINSSSWPKGAGRYVRLPSSLYENFKTGVWRGFGLAGDGTYGTYGISHSAKLKIRYTK